LRPGILAWPAAPSPLVTRRIFFGIAIFGFCKSQRASARGRGSSGFLDRWRLGAVSLSAIRRCGEQAAWVRLGFWERQNQTHHVCFHGGLLSQCLFAVAKPSSISTTRPFPCPSQRSCKSARAGRDRMQFDQLRRRDACAGASDSGAAFAASMSAPPHWAATASFGQFSICTRATS
jgi:hypothetical protein